MYKLTVEQSFNIVELQLSGCLSVAEVARYGGEFLGYFGSGRLRVGYRMLLDVTSCAIQPQETIAAFGRQVRDTPNASRIAIVTGSSVIRLQVRRVMTQPYAKLFDDRPEAMDWLIRAGPSAYRRLTGSEDGVFTRQWRDVDTAFHLVPAAPAAGSRVLTRLHARRAGCAADRQETLRLKGMAGKVVVGKIGV